MMEMIAIVAVVWAGEPESLTIAPKAKTPLAVGVPEITPVAALRVRPPGRAPEDTDQVKAGVPPLADRELVYAVPTLPEASEGLIVNAGGAITIENGDELVCAGVLESLTVTVKLTVPLAVGVPETMPVAGFKPRPAGRLPETDQV